MSTSFHLSTGRRFSGRRFSGRRSDAGRRSRRPLAITLALATLAACGGGDDDAPSISATASTSAAPSTPPSEPSTTPPTTELVIEGAVDATTPTTNPASDEPSGVEPLEIGVQTVAGQTYSLARMTGEQVVLTLTDPEGGRFGYSLPGMSGIGEAADLSRQLVDVFELGSAELFTTPFVDFAELATGVPPDMVTRAPADFLGWIAAQPWVTPGDITDTTFAGHPARMLTYEIGDVEGSIPCYPDGRGCLASITNTLFGYGYVDFENTTMTAYQVDAGGMDLAIMVSSLPGAVEVAATIEIEVAEPPASVGDAQLIERSDPLASGVRYYWPGSSAGPYTLDGDEALVVSPPALPTAQFLVLEELASQSPCMTISDGALDLVLGDEPDASVPDLPIDARVLDAIAAIAALDVVRATSPTVVEGATASAIDVTTDGDVLVPVLAYGLPVEPGRTVRYVAIEHATRAPDLVAVVVGSPCEEVLATLAFHEG